jgi:sec-independent protein translocase protein TatB
MFDVGFSELIVIGIVALVVIGPERLPKVARTAGHLLGRLQRYVNDVKSDISREMQIEELKRIQADIQESARSFERSISAQIQSVEQSVEQSVHSVQAAVEDLSSGTAEAPHATPEEVAPGQVTTVASADPEHAPAATEPPGPKA